MDLFREIKMKSLLPEHKEGQVMQGIRFDANNKALILKGTLLITTAALFLGATTSAYAASFMLKEQSVTNLGNSYAGTAAQADDASTAFYNAAGLTHLENDQVITSFIVPKGKIKFSPEQATNMNGGPIALVNTISKNSALVPGVHLAKRVNDNYSFGLSVVSPFGLKTEYAVDSVVRVMATKSELKTFDISPSFAYKFNDYWSIAVGIDILKGKAQLDSMVEGTAQDGHVQNKLTGWGYGYHLGALLKLSDATRIGLQYRSRINVKGKGNRTSNSVIGNSKVTSKLKLPDILTYSIYHQYDDKWSLLGELEYTHWSLFKEIKLNYAAGNNVIIPENYKNSIRFALGVNYKWNADLILKGGAAFDRSPTRDDTRTARIPDSNRYWLSIGAKYKLNKQLDFGCGWAHLFFKNAALNESAPLYPNGTKTGLQSLKGNYKGKADIMGIQLTWNFV